MYIINTLSKHDLVSGLPKHKYDKDQIYSGYPKGEQAKLYLNPLKTISTIRPLKLLYMN